MSFGYATVFVAIFRKATSRRSSLVFRLSSSDRDPAGEGARGTGRRTTKTVAAETTVIPTTIQNFQSDRRHCPIAARTPKPRATTILAAVSPFVQVRSGTLMTPEFPFGGKGYHTTLVPATRRGRDSWLRWRSSTICRADRDSSGTHRGNR